jgi:hypothetical protein
MSTTLQQQDDRSEVHAEGVDRRSSRRRALTLAAGSVAGLAAVTSRGTDDAEAASAYAQLTAANTWTQKQTFADGIEISPTKHIVLTSNSPSGGISRLIELRMTTTYDRPWLSWFDENGRHRASLGYHTTDAGEGGVHQAFELKTVADEAGPDPADMRTRFSIGTNAQRVLVGFNYCDSVEINQGENVPAQQFGLFLRTTPRATDVVPNAIIGGFSAQLDGSDNAFGYLDIKPPYKSGSAIVPGNRTATLTIFRNTDTASVSSPQIAVKRGDGTNTNAWLFTAKSGLFELPLAQSPATGIRLGGDTLVTLYRSASGVLKTDGDLAVGGAVGFNGAPPAAKPTVSGSRGGNAALGELLTALAASGLITDATTP